MRAINVWADWANLTATSTSQTLQQLITAAWSTVILSEIVWANSVDIFMETNSLRFLDDTQTPEAAKGTLLDASWINIASLRGINLWELRIIRATWSDATFSIRVWVTNVR